MPSVIVMVGIVMLLLLLCIDYCLALIQLEISNRSLAGLLV